MAWDHSSATSSILRITRAGCRSRLASEKGGEHPHSTNNSQLVQNACFRPRSQLQLGLDKPSGLGQNPWPASALRNLGLCNPPPSKEPLSRRSQWVTRPQETVVFQRLRSQPLPNQSQEGVKWNSTQPGSQASFLQFACSS